MIGPRWSISWDVGVCSWGIAGRSAKVAVAEARRNPAGSLAGHSIHEAAAGVQIESVRYGACRPLTSATIKQDCNPQIRTGQNAETVYCPYVQPVTKLVDHSETRVTRAP